MDIRRDFHIVRDYHVQFRYLGNNLFKITVIAGTCSELNMQKYLRYGTSEFNDNIFCVTLTKYQSRDSHFVYVIFMNSILFNKNVSLIKLLTIFWYFM